MEKNRSNRFQMYIADDLLEDFDKLIVELRDRKKSLAGELRPAIEALIDEYVK